MRNKEEKRVRPLKRKGRLIAPELLHQPGSNCRNSCAASVAAIAAILRRGITRPAEGECEACDRASTLPAYMEP